MPICTCIVLWKHSRSRQKDWSHTAAKWIRTNGTNIIPPYLKHINLQWYLLLILMLCTWGLAENSTTCCCFGQSSRVSFSCLLKLIFWIHSATMQKEIFVKRKKNLLILITRQNSRTFCWPAVRELKRSSIFHFHYLDPGNCSPDVYWTQAGNADLPAWVVEFSLCYREKNLMCLAKCFVMGICFG